MDPAIYPPVWAPDHFFNALAMVDLDPAMAKRMLIGGLAYFMQLSGKQIGKVSVKKGSQDRRETHPLWALVCQRLYQRTGDHSLLRAVIVMNPNNLHVQTAIACLQAGKHVLIEKPVAETVEQIDAMVALATKVDRVCMPAYNYIYVLAPARAKRFVEEGRFGQITSLWILYNLYHDEEIARHYGGVLREVCIHHAYSLIYLLGWPKRVTAVSSCVHYRELTCEDRVMVTCEMPDGALAHLWASFAASDPTSDPWTVVYKLLGTEGGVNYTWNEKTPAVRRGGIPDCLDGFTNELRFFAEQAIPHGREPRSPLQHARDAIRIIEAAEESIRRTTGKVEVRFD